VIVTDHHEPTDAIPNCVATLNPKLNKQSYPNRDLTGVGVAFKLAHAITNTLVDSKKISPRKVDLKRYLDLVALGTISDMGALKDENRILVRYGIKQLRKSKRIGLAKLLEVADVDPNQITTYTVASKIAPRLNSLGRIADPQKGVELLLLRNAAQAEKMALELDLNNIERQKIERTMSADIEEMIQKNPEILKEKAIVMHSDKWHPGVIAILSTRISKMHQRPTVMIAIEGGVGKGSLRSISKFPLIPALKKSADILINFGGHDFAAGMTIKKENIELFKSKFIEHANHTLNDMDVMAKLHLDAEVDFEDLTFELMESIKLFEPFGNENLQPVLYTQAKQAWPPKVVGNHLKLYLVQGDRMLEGIAPWKAAMSRKLRQPYNLKIAFSPQVNPQGPSIQLMIRELQIIGK
ncbi:MAG: DHHA1 domain-containing protein, partial [Waddliaceae bacterium]